MRDRSRAWPLLAAAVGLAATGTGAGARGAGDGRERRQPAQAPGRRAVGRIGRLRPDEDPIPAPHPAHGAAPSKDLAARREDPGGHAGRPEDAVLGRRGHPGEDGRARGGPRGARTGGAGGRGGHPRADGRSTSTGAARPAGWPSRWRAPSGGRSGARSRRTGGSGRGSRGGSATGIEEALVGEMTGADRALISSLEGFEDLQLIGRLQLEDRGIRKGDVVICVTEGGETSSVIGTVLAALDQWKSERGRRYDPADEPRAALLRLQQSGRPAAAVRAEPAGHQRAGHHQDQPDDRPAGRSPGRRGCRRRRSRRTSWPRSWRRPWSGRLRRTLGRKDMARLGFAAAGGGAGRTGVAAKLREFGAALDGVQGGTAGPGGAHRHRGGGLRARPVLHLLRREGADHRLHRQHRAEPDLPAVPAGHGQGAGAEVLDPGLDEGRRAGRGVAGVPGAAVPRAGGGHVPAAVRDGGRGPVPEAGGAREPEEGRRRPGRALRFLAVEGQHRGAGAEDGRSRRARRADARGEASSNGRVRRSRSVLRLAGEGGADAAVVLVTDRRAKDVPRAWSSASGAAGRARTDGSS